MAIFSGGYLAVAWVFMLHFRRALNKRQELELDALEVFEMRVSIGASMIKGAAVAISLAIALIGGGATAVRRESFIRSCSVRRSRCTIR